MKRQPRDRVRRGGWPRAAALALALCLSASGLLAREPAWRTKTYTLTARDMPVREALETFGVAEGVPIVSSDSVVGKVSGDFRDVPAGEFLDRLATIHNLTWYYDGATLFVYAAGEVQTMLMDLRYMKADEVKALLRELGVEDARFPIKTASNGEMIMVSGPPRYVSLVAEMISRADKLREQRTFTEVVTRLFPLKYTWADNVSFSTGSSGESSQTIKGVADILRELMATAPDVAFAEGSNRVDRAAGNAKFQPVVRAENRLNAVVVRDVASRMPLYEDLIAQLDKPQKLVEVGVTVLEMSKDDALDWQASLGLKFHDSKNSASAGSNAQNLLSDAAVTGLGAAGAYSYLGEHVDVDASLQAVRNDGRARSIVRTSLLTLNNMTVSLSDTESFTTKLVGEKVADVNESSAGMRLGCKPRVVDPPPAATNAARQIWMTVSLEDGGLDKLNTVDGLPTKRTTSLITQASLPEGTSLLLAGHFKDVDSEAAWGIPYLRDIPWIGWIFGGSSTVKETVQRLFIITPHVVDLSYYAATTQDVVKVQTLRNRNMEKPLELEDALKVDAQDRARHEREIDERRTIRDEEFKRENVREARERQLRTEQRRREQIKENDVSLKDLEQRRRAWRMTIGE